MTYLLVALGALTVLALLVWSVWSDRSERLLQLERDSTNLAVALSVLVGDRQKHVDDDLLHWRQRLSSMPRTPLLADMPENMQWISDDGRLSGGVAPLQHGGAEINTMLAFHRSTARDVLWVGEQLPQTQDGMPMLPISRAVRSADGHFLGVLVGALSLEDVETLAAQFRLGLHGAVGLSDADGQVLARWPAVQGTTGRFGVRWESRLIDRGADTGSVSKTNSIRIFLARSPADGVNRFYAQAGSGSRMVVTVGTSIDEYLAPWLRQSVWTSTFVLLSCALAFILLIRLRGALHRKSKLRRDMRSAFEDLEHLRKAVDVHVMVSITDEAGNFLDANSRFCDMMHLPAEALIGRHQRIFHSGVHPRGYFDEIQERLKTEGIYSGAACERDRLGRIRWFDVTIVAVHIPVSNEVRFISLRTDITAARKAVQELRRDLGVTQATSDALHLEAHTDALTGLPNRRSFDEAALALLAKVREDGRPAALLMMDVDLFKVYNDKLGHAAGDEALRRVAGALRGALRRATDQVYRFGGEEFVALLQPKAEEDVWALAQNLRVAVSNMGLAHPGHPGRAVTISLGYRTITGTQTPADVKQWIESADQALYRAKSAGRNCCVQATGETEGVDP